MAHLERGAPMASIKEITSTFSDAVGPRRYVLPSLALATGAFIDFFMLRYGLIDSESPYAFVPFMLGVLVAGILVIWWLLDYAADRSTELRGIVCIEEALDTLSTYFDEGSELFDATIKNDADYKAWETRRAAWQQAVQDHLQENFGLRERNLFRNVVLIQPLAIDGSFNQEHNRKRSLVAQQLEKIRDTIIRYSDLAAKRRAENG
jgi:hypothetical protein